MRMSLALSDSKTSAARERGRMTSSPCRGPLAKQSNMLLDAVFNIEGGSRNTIENVTKDGRSIVCEWYNTPLIDGAGNAMGVAFLALDITERMRAEARLLHEASHDALTGLPN